MVLGGETQGPSTALGRFAPDAPVGMTRVWRGAGEAQGSESSLGGGVGVLRFAQEDNGAGVCQGFARGATGTCWGG